MYNNADQLVNKRDNLLMMITGDKPDLIMICEVIPKWQVYPLGPAVLEIEDYQCYLNFDANQSDLGKSDIRGVAIYKTES